MFGGRSVFSKIPLPLCLLQSYPMLPLGHFSNPISSLIHMSTSRNRTTSSLYRLRVSYRFAAIFCFAVVSTSSFVASNSTVDGSSSTEVVVMTTATLNTSTIQPSEVSSTVVTVPSSSGKRSF